MEGADAYDCSFKQSKYQKNLIEMEDVKMNVIKENVKVLTKEDVINLSNYTKRQEFLSSYEDWGVWLDIPELHVQIFKAELPNSKAIFVTRFKSYMTYGGKYSSPIYRYGNTSEEYHDHEDSWPFIADMLLDISSKKPFILNDIFIFIS